MKRKEEIINLLSNRFPNHIDFILEHFDESESFQSLCENYYDCKIMLDSSIRSSNKTKVLEMEYEILLKEIEDELLERFST